MKSSQRIRQTLQRYQRKPVTQQGILGNEVGVISVPNRTDFVYVRVAGLGTISIYNKRVPLILDLPVDVGYDPLEPKNFQVLNIHRYPQGGGRGLIDIATILHGKTHNWSGIDPVYIEKRQLMPLRPTPMGGMQVYITREVTYYDDKAVAVTGQQLDLAPYVPATGSWMVLLYKDTDELIKVSTGGVLKDIFTLSLDDAPQAYPGTVPIALIRLYGGQSGIAEGYQDTDLIDVRQLFSPIFTSGTYSGVLTGTSSGGGHIIQDEGSNLPARKYLNFVGAGVITQDDAGNDATKVIITGSSGGIVTGSAIDLSKILLLHPGDQAVEYDDLTTANAAAVDDDIILLPVGLITGSYTLVSGVEYVGRGRKNTLLTGQITMAANTVIRDLSINVTANDANNLIALNAPSAGRGYAYNCDLIAIQSGAGMAAGVYTAVGALEIHECYTKGSSIGLGYGAYNSGGILVFDGGVRIGSTASGVDI